MYLTFESGSGVPVPKATLGLPATQPRSTAILVQVVTSVMKAQRARRTPPRTCHTLKPAGGAIRAESPGPPKRERKM
jgi:hypothetical protein